MSDRIGQQLGNYRLTHLLGQGGFADVYLGEHIYLNTKAAIKVLQTRLSNEAMADFQNGTHNCQSCSPAYCARAGFWGGQFDPVSRDGLRAERHAATIFPQSRAVVAAARSFLR